MKKGRGLRRCCGRMTGDPSGACDPERKGRGPPMACPFNLRIPTRPSLLYLCVLPSHTLIFCHSESQPNLSSPRLKSARGRRQLFCQLINLRLRIFSHLGWTYPLWVGLEATVAHGPLRGSHFPVPSFLFFFFFTASILNFYLYARTGIFIPLHG